MHFRVQTDEINYGLGMVIRAISARPVKQVYDGVLIETMDDGLVLTCTDGEISIKAQVSALVEEDGCALLPAKLFAEMMRKQPAGEVDVQVDERLRAAIRSRGSNTSMACMSAEDFPDIRDVIGDHHVNLPCNRFRDAVSKVQFAVSTDESRKILTGILMEVYEKETLLVGLDGFRLALQRIETENQLPADAGKDHIHAVVPGKVLGEVSKMLPDTDDPALITFNSSHVMYSFGPIRVYATLLTGEFIDYQKILPATWTTEVMVMRSMFSDAIERCSLMAREGKNNLIYLHLISDGRMEMTANAERGDVHEELDIGFEGNELNIAFNSRYLTDIIHNIDGERIRMCFNSNVSPCMIKPVEGDEFTFLVLPVRIFNR
jgi:DNA polymerase-3 subunit beta